MAEYSNLALTADRAGFTTMVDYINNTVYGADGGTRSDIKKEYFYDKMLLDKIKLSNKEYVYLKYATTKEVPRGNEKYKLRRWGGLSAHTTPLIEGMPPRSDKTAVESFEGTFHQYGRYMQFPDTVEWQMLDPIIMEYTAELADVATRTFERLARAEMLASTFQVFANSKTNVGELVLGDTVGLTDYRLAALQMKRLMVKPLGSVFKVIISEEHKYDLLDDPLIEKYIGTNNGMTHYANEVIPTLFGISFEVTLLDDYSYGYQLANPGEFNDGAIKCRIYGVDTDTGDSYYFNLTSANRTVYVADEYREGYEGDTYNASNADSPFYPVTSEMEGGAAENAAYNRLSDGSWIPVRTIWDLAYTFTTGDDGNVTKKAADGTITTPTVDATLVTLLNSLTWNQLPVHVSFMIGKDALIKAGVSGQGGAQMFVKEKGSAGVLDPINQRQSIGFKINTVGFNLLRNEACWVFRHVPTQAPLTAGIGSDHIVGLDMNSTERTAHLLTQ